MTLARLLRLELDGLDAADRNIYIEQLREHWRLDVWTVPGQLVVLAALMPVVWRSGVPLWAWLPPVVLLGLSWAWASTSLRRLRLVPIVPANYRRLRSLTLWRELAQSTGWGLLGAVLWGALPADWHLLILTGLIVFAFTAMFFTTHDSGVAAASNLPIQLILIVRLVADDAAGTNIIALILAAAMLTCLGVGRLIERRLFDAERLRLRNAQLVLELEGEIDKVRQARDDAEAANRQKADFLAAASHDLRQPLHSLTLLSGMLSQSVQDGPPERTLQTAQRMQSAVDGLSFVFDQLFDIARLDAGKQAHHPVVVDLDALLRALHREYAAPMEHQGLRWGLDGPCGLLHDATLAPPPDAARSWALADPLLLQRILRNLLDNALRYTPQGEVRLRWRRRAGAWRLQVWDTGQGIAPALQPRVFDDFVQGHNPQRQRREGLGLGLAVVRRLAQLGGYPLRLRSRLGRGTVFSLEVPLAAAPRARHAQDAQDAHQAPHAPASVPPGTEPASRLVVLVDDEDDVLEAMRDSLQALGWTVATGRHAGEAIEAVARLGRMPDAVMSDWRLAAGPQGPQDGLGCIASLRHEFGLALPAWLLTGDLDPALSERCTQAAVGLLRKPQSAHSLSEALQSSPPRSTSAATPTR